MTRQTWAALVTALMFVSLAAVIALAPVPFVTWQPGRTVDVLETSGERPAIDVAGARTYPTSGQLHLTIVSTTRADASLSLPEGMIAFWLPHRTTLPRDVVHRPGQPPDEAQAEDKRLMDTSQQNAVVAALREADMDVVERPAVTSINVDGPSDGRLELGDLILQVDGREVATVEDAVEAVRSVEVGDVVQFIVLRNGMERTTLVTTTASNSDPRIPVVGVSFGVGFEYAPQVTINIDSRIGGPSAGMIFSLGIYDVLTPGDLLRDQRIGGTGTISPDGRVGSIGGLHEKIRAAEESGVTMFLMPEANCDDLGNVRSQMKLVKVATLTDAVTAVEKFAAQGNDADLPTCER